MGRRPPLRSHSHTMLHLQGKEWAARHSLPRRRDGAGAEVHGMTKPTTPREDVYRAIDRERDFQDNKWGPITEQQHGVAAWLLIMRGELEEAEQAWLKGTGGIDWMTRDELTQAIPPVYTEYIGRQLLACLGTRRLPDATRNL